MWTSTRIRFTSATGAAACLALAAIPLAGAPPASVTPVPAGQQADEAALVARARAIHDRVITLDTHDDISPNNFRPECNYTMRLTTQVNLPKMIEGGLDVSFMIVYVGQGPLTPEGYDNAYRQAVAKFDAVNLLSKELAPNQIGLALAAADVPRIAASGRSRPISSAAREQPRCSFFWRRAQPGSRCFSGACTCCALPLGRSRIRCSPPAIRSQ